MISHKHKFIFVHIPKTAGTSIRNAMNGSYEELHNPYHSSISQIKNKLSDQIFQSYFKFGTVRNPWDREVSRYTYIKRHKQHEKYRYVLNGFKDYLLKFNELGLVHYRALKIGGNIGVDYIMKFENLQQDFNTVCDKIGIPRKKIPHDNKTNHKHYTEYYDNKTKQIVAERYAEDIERFGYKFGE